jgi:thiosulfate/3-mercaptopyruvate sulfurtransferase
VTDDSAVLITADELAALLADGRPPTLLDVRWRLGGPPGRELYQVGHLPGAVFVDMDRELAGPPGAAGRHPLPAVGDFESAMRHAGVGGDRLVVVYDDADSTAAARAWWLLRYFGHPSVRVLDGGFRAWLVAGHAAESGPSGAPAPPGPIDLPATPGAPEVLATPGAPGISSAPRTLAAPVIPGTTAPPVAPGALATPGIAPGPTAPPRDFSASPGHLPLLDADGAAALASTGLLLDARAAERYRGETEPVDPVAGHIPGAVSAPTAENVNADGTFRPAAELAARFIGLGATPGTTSVGVYCGSGVTAAHEALALTLAGIPAALYVGSWSNWITDPTRPIATGAELPPPSRPPSA